MYHRLNSLCALIAATIAFGCGGGPPGPELTSIRVTIADDTLRIGRTSTAAAAGFDQDGKAISLGDQLVWQSSNTAVATVSQQGVIQTVQSGQAAISAVAGRQTGSAIMTVSPASIVTTIQITLTPASPVAGQTVTATAIPRDQYGDIFTFGLGAPEWSSSNPSVATVKLTGVSVPVTTMGAGQTTISTVFFIANASTPLTVKAALQTPAAAR